LSANNPGQKHTDTVQSFLTELCTVFLFYSAQKRKPLGKSQSRSIQKNMPKLLPFYPNADAVPADLKGAYAKAADSEKYVLIELDDDVPIVQTKKSLEATQTTLKEDARKANDRAVRAEAKAMPDGKIAVDPDVEELGNAAKAAGLKTADISTFKTKADEFQGKIDELQGKLDAGEYDKTLASVAEDHGLNNKFVKLAQEKNLKFESRTEKGEGDEEATVWDVVVDKGEGKTEKQFVGDFIEKDAFFSEFADTFSDSENGQKTENGGKKWVKQSSGKNEKSVPGAQKTIDSRYGGTVATLTKKAEA